MSEVDRTARSGSESESGSGSGGDPWADGSTGVDCYRVYVAPWSVEPRAADRTPRRRRRRFSGRRPAADPAISESGSTVDEAVTARPPRTRSGRPEDERRGPPVEGQDLDSDREILL